MNAIERLWLVNLLIDADIDIYDDKYDVAEKLQNNCNMSNDEDFEVHSGASKLCIVFSHKNYVIKWSTSDEAMREATIYRQAVTAHLEQFFPQTGYLTTNNRIDFVVQAKIDTSAYECDESLLRKYRHIGQTVSNKVFQKMAADFRKAGNREYSRDLNRTWGQMVISLYGKNVCKKLCHFIIAHGINDLHCSNIGYKDNKPVILDFCGYGCDDEN